MAKVIGVRFKTSARIYYFDPLDFSVNEGDGVIVETARGQEYGDVAQGVKEVADDQLVAPLKPVIRVASEEDRAMRAANAAKEADAFAVCQKKIEQHKLDMKLVDVEYTFNGSKVVFYFTADERVDFRELVKDLASQFRTRIELRQIGVRDEAKMLGGLGPCGRAVCCKTFLDDFRPVSIKMAKEQNLSLSPTKISGLCGRLMCCLQYEQSAYEEMKKLMPRTGREVQTPDGTGTALENNAITGKTKVRVILPDGSYEIREYHYSLLAKPGEPLPEAAQQLQKAAAEAAAQLPPEGKPEPRYIAPETPGRPAADAAGTAGAAEDAARKRRRRGGRGRGGNGGQQAGQTENGQPGGAQNNGQNAPSNARQAGGQQGRPAQAGQNRQPQPRAEQPKRPAGADGAAPTGTASAPAAGVEGAKPADPAKRRRRRGGANRPRPQGGEPAAQQAPKPQNPPPQGTNA